MSRELMIQNRAGWLRHYARDLAATIGASDPNQYRGWLAEFERAEADIKAIRERIERHKQKDAA